MKVSTLNSLTVWHLERPSSPRKVGVVSLVPSRQRLAFKYDPAWIADGFDLSPDMARHDKRGRPFVGDILPQKDAPAPGAIDDAMPDRWGQSVIRIVDNPPRLTPLDFLFFAGDRRFGCLGVSCERDAYVPHALPPLPKRDSLEDASSLVEKILSRQSVDERERLLLSSSTSMGGARPKMLVEIDGHEWIAKFPKGDMVDMPLVEHATMTLAKLAGIRSAETTVHPVPFGHVLLVKRFDRDQANRIHVISARSMLSKTLRPSYAGLSEAIRAGAPSTIMRERQREVFARLVFNVLMDNTDDHDKNHAFRRLDNGEWDISEAYDLLPQMNGDCLRGMPIGRKKASNEFLAAIAHHDQFGLTQEEAIEEWLKVSEVVGRWRDEFSALGVSGRDIDDLSLHIDTSEKLALRERSVADTIKSLDAGKKAGRYT